MITFFSLQYKKREILIEMFRRSREKISVSFGQIHFLQIFVQIFTLQLIIGNANCSQLKLYSMKTGCLAQCPPLPT